MQAHARVSRIQLQVERGRLHRFLLIAREFDKAIGKGICNAEFHQSPTFFCTAATTALLPSRMASMST